MFKKGKKKKPNHTDWSRIITLSAVGHYIRTELSKELDKLKEKNYVPKRK